MNDTKSYRPGHPNPRFFRPDWQTLNGAWDFLFDDADIGIAKKFYESFPTSTLLINVPYAYESDKSGIIDKSEHNVMWYRKSFECLTKQNILILHIERSDYHTIVWLNGMLVGEHTGGYDEFSFEVNAQLRIGNNELVIRVFDSKDPRQLRGKQTWKEKPFECFYHGTSGIYGDVWLESVNPSYLKSIETRASFTDQKLFVKGLVSQQSIGKNLTIHASFKGTPSFTKKVAIANEEPSFAVDITLPMHLWSPETPHLYDLVFTIEEGDKELDCVLSYFGINSPSKRNQKILLNDETIYLKFVLDQGYFPGGDLTGTCDDFMTDISYLKTAGFNGVRKHEKVEGSLFYYLADRDGLLNWLELPSPHKFDPSMRDVITAQWRRIIAQHISHPSLMAYVCYNESWGVHDIKTAVEQQLMSTHLYQEAKRLDPSRFVISNDGWEHTISDLLTVHNYQESKQDLLATYKDLREQLTTIGNAKANPNRMCYADGFKYRGEPIVFSEFAGIAIDTSTDEGWGYGKPANGVSGFMKKLQGQIEAISENRSFVGYCITQLSDVYQETNGLLTQDRKIKIKPEQLKKIL
jgi:beta-galactosidase/beta-glucuronidase